VVHGITVNEPQHGCLGRGMEELRILDQKGQLLSHPSRKHGSMITSDLYNYQY
jgi:hypothetical protein